MINAFKHTGYILLSDGRQLPYAFGPNQAAMLCQLRGWEFWEHEEKVLPALYVVAQYAQLSAGTVDEMQAADMAQQAKRSLFNDPSFIRDFYVSALSFGHELDGVPLELTPAEVGMWQHQEPTAFLPALTHYAQMQAERVAVASARPTPARRAGEAMPKKPAKTKS